MSRPKGSKNKARVEKPQIVTKKGEVHDFIPCAGCKHGKHMHYDGLKGHCNTSGCPCLEHK